jgi:hypothetical protein
MSEATPDPDDVGVLSVHFGRSANCSSIGSVIDVLFVSGVVGTAVLASLAVLLGGRSDASSGGVDAEAALAPTTATSERTSEDEPRSDGRA